MLFILKKTNIFDINKKIITFNIEKNININFLSSFSFTETLIVEIFNIIKQFIYPRPPAVIKDRLSFMVISFMYSQPFIRIITNLS